MGIKDVSSKAIVNKFSLIVFLKKQKHMVVKNKTNRRAKPSFLISERVIKKTKAIKYLIIFLSIFLFFLINKSNIKYEPKQK